jgi:hypothetical protein
MFEEFALSNKRDRTLLLLGFMALLLVMLAGVEFIAWAILRRDYIFNSLALAHHEPVAAAPLAISSAGTLVPLAGALFATLSVIVSAILAMPSLIRRPKDPLGLAGSISNAPDVETIRLYGQLASIKNRMFATPASSSSETRGATKIVEPDVPFEIEQLAAYYALSLGQAKTSFWFSLVFAAIGFVIIVGSGVLYTQGAIVAASIKLISGLIVDAVSALFFVQSQRAQVSMFTFFEKLRSDRQYAEARKICDELNDNSMRDHLKAILVLQYTGLDAKSMIEALPAQTTPESKHKAEPKG